MEHATCHLYFFRIHTRLKPLKVRVYTETTSDAWRIPRYPTRKHCVTSLYCIVLYCIVLYCIVLYCIVLYCIVLYCIVLYCIVLYCIVYEHVTATPTGTAEQF